MSSVENAVRRANLVDAPRGEWVVSGSFQFPGAVYSGQFDYDVGLLEGLDMMMSRQHKPATPAFILRPRQWDLDGPKAPPSNLRFDFDRKRNVAAAVCLVCDRWDNVYAWMTRGDAGRDDVELVHDPWNPGDTTFPPSSFITIAQLRELMVQWAFGDVLPPPAVEWTTEDPDVIGWF
jgi:hypothetical protein